MMKYGFIKNLIHYSIGALFIAVLFLCHAKDARAFEPIEMAQSLKDKFKNQSKNVARQKSEAGKLFLENTAKLISTLRKWDYIELTNLPSSANELCFGHTHLRMNGGSWGAFYSNGVFFGIYVGRLSKGDKPKISPVGKLVAGNVIKLVLNPDTIISQKTKTLFRQCKIEFDPAPTKKGRAKGKFYMSIPTFPRPEIVEGNWEKEGRKQLSSRHWEITRRFQELYGVLIEHKDGLINRSKFYQDNWQYDLHTLEQITRYIADNRDLCFEAHRLSKRKGASFRCNSISELSYATRMGSHRSRSKPGSSSSRANNATPAISVLKDGVAPPKEQIIKNAIKFNWKNKSYYVTYKKQAEGGYVWVFHKDKRLTQGQRVATLESYWVKQLTAEVKRQSNISDVVASKSSISVSDRSGGWIGVNIEPVTPEIVRKYGLGKGAGAFVNGVRKYGPAANGGVRATDVILRFNNQFVTDVTGLIKIVSKSKVNHAVNVEVWRDRKKMVMQIRPYPRPKEREYSNGDKYLGYLKNGKRHGWGEYSFTSGDHYIGHWQNGKRHGRGANTSKDGTLREGLWRDDKFISNAK